MKNIIIAALVGISFLTSGFWIGLRLAPMPKKPATAAVADKAAPKPVDPKVAFSIESLKRASENILGVNDALQTRERVVAAREKTAAQKEDEMAAERAALDRLHAQFKMLYSEFEKRLQLVTDDETAALQRQVTIYSTMDVTQSVELIRALDDATVTRMFVLMDDKALAKIVAAWKTKYPAEAPRLLADLNGMGRVVAKDKIRLPDGAPTTDSAMPEPPASTDVSTPAGAPAAENAAAANAPAPDSTAAPASAPANETAPASDNAPVAAPVPASDSTTPAAPAPDATTPPATAPAPSAAPSADDAPTAPSAPAANSTSASTTGESTLPLDTPGETAAKAANTGDNSTPTPTQIIPATTPTMHLAHEKPARFASARNN